jgi:hypothetical protein
MRDVFHPSTTDKNQESIYLKHLLSVFPNLSEFWMFIKFTAWHLIIHINIDMTKHLSPRFHLNSFHFDDDFLKHCYIEYTFRHSLLKNGQFLHLIDTTHPMNKKQCDRATFIELFINLQFQAHETDLQQLTKHYFETIYITLMVLILILIFIWFIINYT